MNPACSNAIGTNRPPLFTQAGNDQDVRQHPDAGVDRSALHPTLSFIVAIDRQVNRLLSFLRPAQQEFGVPGAPDGRGAGVGPGTDTHRNASQPVLRVPEAAESAYGSGNRQLNPAGSLALQGLVPPACAQASAFTGSSSAARSSDPCTAKAALDKAYRRELAAWVASAEPRSRSVHHTVKRTIYAYLEAAEEQGWLINLSGLDLSTLSPLPENLKALVVSFTDLIALPENLPQGLQTLDVSHTELSALPKNLPQGLLRLDVSCTNLSDLPENLPQGLLTLDISRTKLSALPKNLPQGLQTLDVSKTNLTPAALLTLMQTNTSITTLVYDGSDPVSMQRIHDELANNQERPARLDNAAASLDLLTRLAFTTSDQTDTLIKRASTPNPVAGRLPEPSIPAELHDVLAANSPKSLLAVLAGMVDGRRQ